MLRFRAGHRASHSSGLIDGRPHVPGLQLLNRKLHGVKIDAHGAGVIDSVHANNTIIGAIGKDVSGSQSRGRAAEAKRDFG
jgi:hypothetical protein